MRATYENASSASGERSEVLIPGKGSKSDPNKDAVYKSDTINR